MSRPGFLLSAWPWRSVGYLLSGAVAGPVVLVGIGTLAVAGGALTAVLVGLPLLVTLALSGVVVARMERRRLRLVDADPVPDPHREPTATGLRAWLTTRLKEQATWRELGYTPVSYTHLTLPTNREV